MPPLSVGLKTPEPFLEVHVKDLSVDPTLRGLCAGYEAGEWRMTEFARHIIEWLPEFALDHSECSDLGPHNAVKLAAKAAAAVYTSDKYKLRGEFGEILLHIALRQECGTTPAISKIYFKSSANDTVKGFDAVHVVGPPGGLELWLGEVKFYDEVTGAIRDVVAELHKHVKRDYLREEFTWIGNKLDPAWEHATEIESLLSRNTSLDKVFKRVCFPVLLTYDSECVAKHKACEKPFLQAFEQEIRRYYAAFVAKKLPKDIRIHLFLLPVLQKKALATELDRRLKLWQQM